MGMGSYLQTLALTWPPFLPAVVTITLNEVIWTGRSRSIQSLYQALTWVLSVDCTILVVGLLGMVLSTIVTYVFEAGVPNAPPAIETWVRVVLSETTPIASRQPVSDEAASINSSQGFRRAGSEDGLHTCRAVEVMGFACVVKCEMSSGEWLTPGTRIDRPSEYWWVAV